MDNERIAQLKSILESDPEDTQALFLLGYEYNRTKQYEDAANALEQCVDQSPENAAAWKQLGDALRKLDRKQDALKAYRKGADAGKGAGNEHTARECESLFKKVEHELQ